MSRKEVRMLPTVITDRYGNTVNFTYDPVRRGNLTKITASDGRSLTFTYGNSGYPYLITSVTDGTRTWTYTYSGADMNLDTVTQPDNSTWSLSGINNLLADIQYVSAASCDSPAGYYDETRTGTMTHPSGATATFTMKTTTHGRSKVYLQCMMSNDGGNWARVPSYYYTFSLIGKSLSGPGLPSTNWSYDYGPPNASWSTCTSNCPSTKTVTVTDPSSFVTRYTFGNAYQSTDGKLLKEEAGWNGSSAPPPSAIAPPMPAPIRNTSAPPMSLASATPTWPNVRRRWTSRLSPSKVSTSPGRRTASTCTAAP